VTVTDPESGDPLEASVSIDGAPLGETGEDGELWVVPPTEEFELNVRTADASINETVS